MVANSGMDPPEPKNSRYKPASPARTRALRNLAFARDALNRPMDTHEQIVDAIGSARYFLNWSEKALSKEDPAGE